MKPMNRLFSPAARALLAGAALLLGPAPGPGAALAQDDRQQVEIHALIQELDYLIDHAERLAARYGRDTAPIRFNYRALLEQLRLTRDRSAAYLNEAHAVVHAAPPRPAGASLARRR
jgi:hypothetical protein